MGNRFEESFEDIIDHLDNLGGISPDSIPDLDLYMDQVLALMDKYLSYSKRQESDKTLTKTMINNYAKEKLFPSPVKKRYSREHILSLMYIYYFKNIMSIKDIEKVLGPVTTDYFSKAEGLDYVDIYEEIFQTQKNRIESLTESFRSTFDTATGAFADAELTEEKRMELQQFSFICSLCFDIYVKKLMVEKMIDSMPDVNPKEFKRKSRDH